MICADPVNHINCTLISESFQSSTSSNVILSFWHLFAFFWSEQFINAIGIMTVAGTVGKWYFAKKQADSLTVLQAFGCTLACHLGSAAFGSFVIAVIQLVRSIMIYLDKKLNKSESSNSLVKCGFKCCHCCLLCLEKCMKYISRNAYVLVINRGKNFMSASVDSFGLLASNLMTVSVLKSVSTLFIWMGVLTNCLL